MVEREDSSVILHSVADFAEDAKANDDRTFRALHGGAFLLQARPYGFFRRSARSRYATENVDVTDALKPGPGDAAAGRPSRPLEFQVFPVRHTGRSPFPDLVTVGRTNNNDVVIPDVSVSKFHAFFKLEADGKYLLQDADSRNGTLLNDQPVPKQSEGRLIEIESGMRVRFGHVDLRFLVVAEFRDLVCRLTASAR